MLGFKSSWAARCTIAGMEVMHAIRKGQLMVTGNTYRHPAVLAHIAATVDVVSGGRLDFGIGAGWNEYEHHCTQ